MRTENFSVICYEQGDRIDLSKQCPAFSETNKKTLSLLAVSWKSAATAASLLLSLLEWASDDLARNPKHVSVGFYLTFENNFK